MKYLKRALMAALLLCAAGARAQATPLTSALPDGTLSAVLARASQASRPVQAASRALEAAQADQLSAAATPPALLSLNTSAIDRNHLGSGPLWQRPVDTVLRLDQPFERGGKAQGRLRVAQAGVAAARQDLLDAARLQRIAAAQSYWDLKLAQVQRDLSERNGQLAQASSQAAQQRLAQGDISRLEATRLAVEAERAANERTQAQQQLSQARWGLLQVLALETEAASLNSLRASDDWPSPDVVTAALGRPLDDDAWLAQRADVQAAAQRVTQAQAALDLAQAQRHADVTVGVQLEHYPPNGQHLWGVGVSVPLGVDGRQDGPVRRAAVALGEAQAQWELARAGAMAEKGRWQATLQATGERLQRLQDQILPQARQAVQAAEFARQQGALALQDVLDARRTLHATELEQASAQADVAKALMALTLTPETAP